MTTMALSPKGVLTMALTLASAAWLTACAASPAPTPALSSASASSSSSSSSPSSPGATRSDASPRAGVASVNAAEPADDGIDYGFPVKRFPLELEGQQVTMAYLDVPPTAAPNGKSVVLLHGKNFGGYYFRRVIESLREGGYRVIVPDQIGFGKSSRPVIAYSFHGLANNTKLLLESLGISRAAMFGHSMGGMLAIRYALSYPERVSELILEDPIGLEDYRTFVPYTTVDQKLKAELATTADSIRKYFQTSYFPQWKPDYDALVDAVSAYTKRPDFSQSAKVAALTTEMIYMQPVQYELDRIRVPTLLFVGTADRTIVGKALLKPDVIAEHGRYDRLGKETARKIPGSKLVELPGIGHIPHIEDFDRFNTELRAFLAARR
ncbi:alpha/beta fold hydrolase [Pendulispora albinea]|uniref:Alpha/beta hydrolase n=1 Tax=Pendulispora albinea TaxID=2741071 RepID=A0ABZ2LNL3_9BACT